MTTAERRRRALLMDRDRADLERLGVRAAAQIGRDARLASLRALAAGDDPIAAALDLLQEMRPLLVEGSVAGHLRGRARTIVSVRHAAKRIGLAASDPYAGAVRAMREQQALTSGDLEGIRQRYDRQVSNTIEALSRGVLGKLGPAMAEITEQNLHLAAGKQRLREAFKAAGIEPENSYTVENLFRTQTQIAYAAGRWESLQSPEVDEILWGFEYSTVGDDRVRKTHAAMDGVRLPKDDPFWQRNFPPNGYSCRCAALEIFEGDAEATPKRPRPRTIDGERVRPEADSGFQFNPGRLYTSELPDIRATAAKPDLRQAKWVSQLTDDQLQAMVDWTNTPAGYDAIRNVDRGRRSTPEDRAKHAAFMAALDKAPRFKGTVYRGLGNVPAEMASRLRPGKPYVDPGVFASSRDAKIGREYIYRNAAHTAAAADPGRNVLLEMRVRSGRDISAPSAVKADREVVVPGDTPFRVVERWVSRTRLAGVLIRYTHLILVEDG